MRGLVPFKRTGITRSMPGFAHMYNMLDDFFGDFRLDRNLSFESFRMDVQESEDGYLIEAELPGVKREEINISVNDGRISVSVHREQSNEESRKNYLHRERSVCSMQRSVYLDDIDPEGIKAKLDNGVLRLDIRKQKQAGKANNIIIE